MMKRFFGGIILVFIVFCAVEVTCSIPSGSGVASAQDEQSKSALPSDFDWKQYLANYPDLQQSGIDTKEKAEKHWVEFGDSEKRTYKLFIPVDFNWKQYIANYSDLQQSGVDTKEKAEKHWVEFGRVEGRSYKKAN